MELSLLFAIFAFVVRCPLLCCGIFSFYGRGYIRPMRGWTLLTIIAAMNSFNENGLTHSRMVYILILTNSYIFV